MKLFDFLKNLFNKSGSQQTEKETNSSALSPEDQRFNKMWDLWAEGKISSPYAELMTYQSEINNGGHDQFFYNVSQSDNVERVVGKLYKILPETLASNLRTAHNALLENGDDMDANEEVFEGCDDIFYENEELINHILQEYSKTIEI
ncbi:MAG: DUF4375 domain-containing protein [Clostridia bacterium]|nr:DUF4375 domain-containing protein [Clostridia bacterium]